MLGDVAPNDDRGFANEVQMFERADGSVVLNARQHLGTIQAENLCPLAGILLEVWSPSV
jgi:hypothetical protein